MRIRCGYRCLQGLLQREGWSAGKNLVCRPYTEEGLQLRSKRPRHRKMAVGRRERYVPKRPNQALSMVFVSDQLVNGTRFRALPIVGVFTREALDIVVAQRLRSERVFDLWAYHCGVTMDINRPGKPTDNCFIETFNRSFRDECLNVHWFESIDEAKAKIVAWRKEYKESRPR